jgi:hypothetical protein
MALRSIPAPRFTNIFGSLGNLRFPLSGWPKRRIQPERQTKSAQLHNIMANTPLNHDFSGFNGNSSVRLKNA